MRRINLANINIFLVCVVLFLSSCTGKISNKKENEKNDQDVNISDAAAVRVPVFDLTEHDFGEIGQGEEVGARFLFENQGEVPLVVSRVSTGCGCTVAEYSRQPVLPGEAGFVEVVFDSKGKSGTQYQEVRVYFEGVRMPSRLTIIAQVV